MRIISNKTSVFEKSIETTTNILMCICSGALLVMMFLGTADVLGRYLFNKPIIGTTEIFEILLPIMALCGFAYAQWVKAHIKVDIFSSRLPPRVQTILGFALTLFSIGYFAVIAWQGTLVAIYLCQQGAVISNIQVPKFFIQLLVPLGTLVMCLVLIIDLIHFLTKMRKSDYVA